MRNRWIVLIVITLSFALVFSLALADGTETLGPPSIPIASGNGLFAAGVGMAQTESGEIDVSIPDGATITQVLLYWEGQMEQKDAGDDTIVVNGTAVTGQSIGGPTLDWNGYDSEAFRADITDMGFVTSGETTLALDGLNFSHVNDGAGVLVLYQEGESAATIELVDGLDLAFINWTGARGRTEPQTFTFAASEEARTAQLSLFVASVVGEISGRGDPRPNSIEVTIGGDTLIFSDLLGSKDGEEWDTQNLEIPIPAGADSLTVQLFSRDDNDTEHLPASLNWITAALLVPGEGQPVLEVSKTCTPDDVFVGDEIAYEIAVSNIGDETVTGVEVNDSLLGLVAEFDSLAPGESRTINETMIAAEAGVVTNQAWATGTVPSDQKSVESEKATAECTAYELELTKDAQTSLQRRYIWEINKTVNGEKSIDLTLLPNQVASPDYSVVVDLADPPYAESGWVVSGNIMITNPAPMDAYLNAVMDIIPDFYLYAPVIASGGDLQNTTAVQDQHNNNIPPGMSVPVDCPSLTVPAGETLVCTYGPVDLSSGLSRPNYAFAELKNTVGGDFNGTTLFSGMAQIDFSAAEITPLDEEITVTDSRQGSLGTANINDDALPKSFDYQQNLPPFSVAECKDADGTDSNMRQIPNTSTFTTNDTGTTGDSSANVNLVCIASASVGFEDLPLVPREGNDWDYNDALVEVSFNPLFSPDNDLRSITFNFVQPVNISVNTHEFHIQPNVFQCDGTYSLSRNGTVVVAGAPYQNGQNLTILDSTELPDSCAPNTATLEINFDEPSSPGACALDLSGYDPIGTFNGEGLFYVPSLVVKHPADNQDGSWPAKWYTIKPNAQNPDPRIVGVPETWIWPDENVAVWTVYPQVESPPPDRPGPVFSSFWWDDYTGPGPSGVCKLGD